ncbi:MAG TPA: aminoglycoside phosphotransferase family protein [Actinopolymorphaceae bacterium]|jgi:aminoglycoside phosphotransferase (APT) family kinase protein
MPSDDADGRLAIVLAAAGLHPGADPAAVTSHSNDTWLIEDPQQGQVVLRVCWRGDTDRLLREGTVGADLPAEVGYPPVLGFGRVPGDRDLSWTVTRRLAGMSLADAWPGLHEVARRDACRQVAHALRAMHEWSPSAAARAVLVPTPLGAHPSTSEVIGRSINPLPDGLALLVEDARRRGADATVLDEALRLVDLDAQLVPRLDDPAAPHVIHADLHLNNVWWDGHAVSGLLDLEWVRLGPRYVDVARIKDNADADELEGLTSHPMLLRCLREDYPELFAVDQPAARLRLLQVAHVIRDLCIWGLPVEEATMPVDHPMRALRHLLAFTD